MGSNTGRGGRVVKGKMPNAGNKLVIETAPWTNGDAIRDMTDEELAEWLSCNCAGDGYGNRAEDWLDWLREECT